jgi:hypothetical protein
MRDVQGGGSRPEPVEPDLIGRHSPVEVDDDADVRGVVADAGTGRGKGDDSNYR